MDAEDWDERYAATDVVWSIEPNRFVAQEVAHLPPGRAVDLAAGEGRNAIWLASRGWEVTAVDFSGVGIDKGRELAGDVEVDWVVGDVLEWEPDAPYDLALLIYLQVPAPQRREAVRRAHAALAPGGTLLVVAHDTTNLTEGVGGPQDASVLMTAEDVLADLEGLPHEVVRAERVERPVTVQEEHRGEVDRVALDCLVRVVRR